MTQDSSISTEQNKDAEYQYVTVDVKEIESLPDAMPGALQFLVPAIAKGEVITKERMAEAVSIGSQWMPTAPPPGGKQRGGTLNK